MIQDRFNRMINYMRISITDRCNLRCRYCMPEGITCVPMSELLTYEEIRDICAQALALGIDRFKITGGEPLLHPDMPAFLEKIRALGYRIKLDTNGSFPDCGKTSGKGELCCAERGQ